MKAVLKVIFDRFGRDATVVHGGEETTAKVFLEPVSFSDIPEDVATTLGTADSRKWKLMTRTALSSGDTVVCEGRTYCILSCEPVYAGRELSHWEGVLRQKQEEIA